MTALMLIEQEYSVSCAGASPITLPIGRKGLARLFARLGFTQGAEVGVWEGGHAEKLCRLIPGLQLLCVDPWQPYAEYREKKNDPIRLEAAYQATVTRLAPFNCRVWRMTSVSAARRIPDRSLDFVYLDGNHARAFVLEDLAVWTPKIRRGGIMAGHDYRTQPTKPFIEVEAAVDEFTRAHGIAPVFALTADKSPSFFWVVS